MDAIQELTKEQKLQLLKERFKNAGTPEPVQEPVIIKKEPEAVKPAPEVMPKVMPSTDFNKIFDTNTNPVVELTPTGRIKRKYVARQNKNLSNIEKEILNDFDVTAFIKIGFHMLARWRGNHWELDTSELEEYSKSINSVLNKYIADTKYFDIYMLGFETLLIISVRIGTDVDIKKKQKASEPAPAQKPISTVKIIESSPVNPDAMPNPIITPIQAPNI